MIIIQPGGQILKIFLNHFEKSKNRGVSITQKWVVEPEIGLNFQKSGLKLVSIVQNFGIRTRIKFELNSKKIGILDWDWDTVWKMPGLGL